MLRIDSGFFLHWVSPVECWAQVNYAQDWLTQDVSIEASRFSLIPLLHKPMLGIGRINIKLPPWPSWRMCHAILLSSNWKNGEKCILYILPGTEDPNPIEPWSMMQCLGKWQVPLHRAEDVAAKAAFPLAFASAAFGSSISETLTEDKKAQSVRPKSARKHKLSCVESIWFNTQNKTRSRGNQDK